MPVILEIASALVRSLIRISWP